MHKITEWVNAGTRIYTSAKLTLESVLLRTVLYSFPSKHSAINYQMYYYVAKSMNQIAVLMKLKVKHGACHILNWFYLWKVHHVSSTEKKNHLCNKSIFLVLFLIVQTFPPLDYSVRSFSGKNCHWLLICKMINIFYCFSIMIPIIKLG